jgi:hypothetical protein
VTLWVNRVVLGALADVGSSPDNEQTSDPPRRSKSAKGRLTRGKKAGWRRRSLRQPCC